MKKTVFYCVLVLSVLVFSASPTVGCVNVIKDSDSSSTVIKTYSDQAAGFSISYPANWLEVPIDKENKAQGVLIAFNAPKAENNFKPNFNIVIEDMGAEYDLQTYYRAVLNHIQTAEGYRSISDDNISINGIPAIEHIFNATAENGENTVMQVYLVQGTNAWTISCFSASESFESMKPTFDAVVNSFKLSGSTFSAAASTASLSEATMTTDVDDDLRPVDNVRIFNSSAPVVNCSVKVSNAPLDTQITIEWIYVKGQVPEPNYVFGDYTFTGEGTGYVSFYFERPDNGWWIGEYEAVLYLDGVEQQRLPFSIQ